MNEEIKLDRDLEQTCGSSPKLWFSTTKDTWKDFMMSKWSSITEAVNGAWEIFPVDHDIGCHRTPSSF